MLRSHHLFTEIYQDLDEYASGDSFEVEEETKDMDGNTIKPDTYSVVENWEDFVLITDEDGNRYKYPKS